MRTDLEEFRLKPGAQVGGIAVNQALRERCTAFASAFSCRIECVDVLAIFAARR
ncbi:MAG: hypothetical protein QOH97_2619, partial [Actinoplanes sp.]|nr:hypothetical protein [Actinoplanes sp.]